MTRVWRCGRFELALDRPLVMGILNVTPDSFSDGGDFEDPVAAVAWGERLISAGANIVDVGGESTRPGSDPVFPAEELSRVRPVVTRLSINDVPISIDTRHVEVARGCIEAGASIVNDVSGFLDPEMVGLVTRSDVGVVIMHMRGDPKSMQAEPEYADVVSEVGGFLLAQAALLEATGIERERIAIDPGIGFGKTLEHNLALLRGLPQLAEYGYPVVIGASRKRFIGEVSGEAEPKLRLGGSIAAAIESVRGGASVVRVHDVADTVQAFSVVRALRS